MTYSNKIQKELNLITERLGLEELSETSYFPKYFEIDPIRACNAKCIMCPVWEKPAKNPKMSDSLFSKIAEEMVDYSEWINNVCLSRNGEPLLDKNLEKKIQLLKNYGINHVNFSTNASLLNQNRAYSLLDSGLDEIMFSIDGATKETFEHIRRGLNFEKVVKNCLKFIEVRNKTNSKTNVRIRMVLKKENEPEEEKWRNFWLSKISKKDIIYSKRENSWGNQVSKPNKQNVEKYSSTPCVSLWGTMIIHYDGKVPLCGVDYDNKFLMGNLHKKTIKNIWNGEGFNHVRKMHSHGKRNNIDLCCGCNIWDLKEKKVYTKESKK